MNEYFLGIDIGSQGARAVLLNGKGSQVSSAQRVFLFDEAAREEQSPDMWWQACILIITELLSLVKLDLTAILGVSVSSTSGTVIPLNFNNRPLHNALMYSDQRSATHVRVCNEAAVNCDQTGVKFNSSSGLAKMVWFANAYPEKHKSIVKWIHAADFITGMLTGVWGVTDCTNALKSGYDIHKLEWPAFIYESLPLRREWLPIVVASGTVIGGISTEASTLLGLPKGLPVTAGITDGCASQIASGAVNPGEWNTTIGTTMVIKGVTTEELFDPLGRIYSHRHPEGFWMPGGASNTGADWITDEFSESLLALNVQAMEMLPTGLIAYPLKQRGERFPIIAPQARGFEPDGLSRVERFAANMEGVAYLERYSYELIERLSKETVGAIFTAGGGSNSDTWLKIRTNVLNKPLVKMKYSSGAAGAAILAASQTKYTKLTEAAAYLVVQEKEVLPETFFAAQYEESYQRFISTMKTKGYLDA
jgi:sugar (pentulose or hexulose) kinase